MNDEMKCTQLQTLEGNEPNDLTATPRVEMLSLPPDIKYVGYNPLTGLILPQFCAFYNAIYHDLYFVFNGLRCDCLLC